MLQRRHWVNLVIISALLGSAGCRCGLPEAAPNYRRVDWALQRASMADYSTNEALPPAPDPFWLTAQPVEAFLDRALAQNPAIHAAQQRLEAAAAQLAQAGSLDDPMLAVNGWPFFPNVPQTAAGVMTAEIMVEQRIPWLAKLEARVAASVQELEAARAQRAAVELEVVEQVKRTYYQLYATQRISQILQTDRRTLESLRDLALARYRANQATQQEVLRMEAELDQIDIQLAGWVKERQSAQAELARLLHLSPDTPFVAADPLDEESDLTSLDQLYQRALELRPELHAQLAEVQKERYRVELARLDYLPEPSFRAGWAEMTTRRSLSPVADGLDMVTIGVSVNLPIYRGRLDSAVREAQANVVWAARQYDRLRDETLRDIKQRFVEIETQRQILQLLRTGILPKTEQAYQVAVQGYQVGTVSFADLLAVFRELLAYRVALVQTESQYRQTLASLERLVGGLLAEQDRHADDSGAAP